MAYHTRPPTQGFIEETIISLFLKDSTFSGTGDPVDLAGWLFSLPCRKGVQTRCMRSTLIFLNTMAFLAKKFGVTKRDKFD